MKFTARQYWSKMWISKLNKLLHQHYSGERGKELDSKYLAIKYSLTILPIRWHLRVIKFVCLWTFKSNCCPGWMRMQQFVYNQFTDVHFDQYWRAVSLVRITSVIFKFLKMQCFAIGLYLHHLALEK